MFEFIDALIACVILIGIMIAIVEFKIRSRIKEIEEREAMYASENQERHQGSNEG